MSKLTTLILTLACLYLPVVRLLRFKRIKSIHSNYSNAHSNVSPPALTRSNDKVPTRAEIPLTPAEAQSILLNVLTIEMPFISNKALEFALFKTYGIESISKLLKKTTEFSSKLTAGRRYSDTGLLIFAFLAFPIVGPGSGLEEAAEQEESGVEKDSGELLDPRSALAVARINWIHSRYGSQITNDDLLYTLSTFILEPAVWAKQFEWRPLTPVEEMAFFVFFSEIGRRMGIKEIPNELEDLIDWAENYEEKNMKPTESSRDVASATTALLLFNVPAFLHPFGVKVISTLLYDRLRESIMLPKPPKVLFTAVKMTLLIRAFLIKNCFLPRFKPQMVLNPKISPAFPIGYIKESDGEEKVEGEETEIYAPRMLASYFVNEPWYSPKPTGFNWLLSNILYSIGVLREDQIPNDKFKPEGFRLEEMGPVKFEGKGLKEIKILAEKIQGSKLQGPYAVGGVESSRCPFSF